MTPLNLKLRLPLAFLLIASVAPSWLNAQDLPAQTLKWKLAAGDRFVVESTQQSNSTTTVSKRTVQTESSTILKMDWSVTGIDDDQNAIIDQTITSIKASVDNPAVPSKAVKFDTESKTKPSRESAKILKQIQPLIGLQFTITLSPRGEIISVATPDATTSALQKLPESLALADLFGELGVQKLLGAATIVLPKKELRVDSDWQTVETDATTLGAFTRTRTYKLDELSGSNGVQIAAISFETDYQPSGSSTLEPTDPSSQKPTGKLISFQESGILKFDISDGFFQSAETSSTTQTEIPYFETKIETTIDNSTKLTITKL